MNLFRIEISGEIPEGDHDMGPHAHVAASPAVAELVKLLTTAGLGNVTRHIRVVRQKAVVATPPPKLTAVPPNEAA